MASTQAQLSDHRPISCSIVIPVFNKVTYTERCLAALTQHTPAELYEVILVDNASTDGTDALLEHLSGDVRVVRNTTNLGFAKACNQGLRLAQGTHVVFLNNDTEPHQGWLEPLLKALEDPTIGLVASKLLYPNETIQHAGKVWSDVTSINPHPYHLYHCLPNDFPGANKARAFQLVTGACIAMRREDALTLGGFDEGYLNGWEDDDLCMRVQQDLCKRVWLQPDSVVIHHENATIKTIAHSNETNQQRFLGKWHDRLRRDDLDYLLADGQVLRMDALGRLQWIQAPTCIVERPRILIANLVRAGDVFLATPMAAAVKRHHPEAIITFATAPAFVGLLEGNPDIDEILPFGPNDFSEQAWLDAKHLAASYDAAYFIQPFPDFKPHFFSTFRNGNWHIVDLYSALSGLDIRADQPHIFLNEDDTSALQAVLKTEGLNLDDEFVVLHTLSADKEKNWGLEKFERLAIHLRASYPNLRLIVVGGAESKGISLPGAVSLAGRLSLRQSAALIARARLFVGIDSVCAHLTAQAHTPAVVLFGFTDPSYSAPRNPQARCIKGPGRYTSDLPYGPVWEAVQETLEGCPPARPVASLVILTYNQLDVTKLCIESIYRHTQDFELIIVDNASKDGTVDYLKGLEQEHSNVKLILNSENRGFAGGCNQGMALAAGEWIVLLNNDTVVGPEWLSMMIGHAKRTGAGIVGPRTNCISGPQQLNQVDYDQVNLEGLDAFANRMREMHRGQLWEYNRAVGFCMLLSRPLVDRIGGLDESYGVGNFEDDDFCARARLAGCRIVIADDVFIHHFGSVTFKGQRIDYSQTLELNWQKFKRKWLLPEDLPLQGGYTFASLMELPFDPAYHTEPLFSTKAPALALPDRKGFNLVTDADPASLPDVTRTYLEAFAPDDDVCLHVLAGAHADVAQQLLLEALESLGMDPDHIPDISLLDHPTSRLDYPSYIQGADLVVGSKTLVNGAIDMGIPALRDANPSRLREAYQRHRAIEVA